MTHASTSTPDSGTMDVFLSHNSVDKPFVAEIARRLLNAGITPWLDVWNLIPGQPWQEAIEAALESCSSCAVFIGPSGAGPWQNEEMRTAIDQRVHSSNGKFGVIPVYLPGANREQASLPMFLKRHTWVDFVDSADDDEAFRRLVCGIQGKAPGPATGTMTHHGQCPYRGLQSFDVNDAKLFFGRDALRNTLLAKIRPSSGPRQRLRLLGILGPSGSGKSSLARAGLVASIRNGELESSQNWPTVILRPGANPLESLGVALSDAYSVLADPTRLQDFVRILGLDQGTLGLTSRLILRGQGASSNLVVVVDQFEEVFTLCKNEDQRKAFIDNLAYAASVIDGQTIIVVVMRADFYGKCAQYQTLATALAGNQILVGQMSPSELRNAITEPAKLTGFRFEPGLIDKVIEDASREPSALPLLQHTLLELWEHRKGDLFTHDAYREMGGLAGALERRAEAIFGGLTVEEQNATRRLLLRLVEPGIDTDSTKRRVPLRALVTTMDPGLLDDVLSKLTAADARLLFTQTRDPIDDDPTVELSHEALIKSWKRLRDWIDENKQDLITQRRLEEATKDWLLAAKNDAYLYRGTVLSQASDWAGSHETDITKEQRDFLERSIVESATQSGVSDAAALDQLESAAKDAWLDPAAMDLWISRGRQLAAAADAHTSNLERLQKHASADEKGNLQFRDHEHRFQYETLSLLISRLRRFRTALLAAAEHVRDVVGELDYLHETEYKPAWDEALKEICTLALYHGLEMKAQRGLVPLGLDRWSGLYEFVHVVTGTAPPRDEAGKLILDEMSGIVFVLIPGGDFDMGAIRPTPALPNGSPNVDPYAIVEEGPVHRITVAPFFISKFLMTQGQWLRAAGTNPSMFRPGKDTSVNLLHPVECVSWFECIAVLSRLGLTLPRENEWEYAARAGTTSVWWLGNDPAALSGKANLQSVGHCPVSLYDFPNNFGLYDVIGNVWEWCLDWAGDYGEPGTESLNPYSDLNSTPVSRGGSFFNDPTFARSAIRYFKTPRDARFNNRGLRPARQIEL